MHAGQQCPCRQRGLALLVHSFITVINFDSKLSTSACVGSAPAMFYISLVFSISVFISDISVVTKTYYNSACP